MASLRKIATTPAKLSAKSARIPAKSAKAPAKGGAQTIVKAIRDRATRTRRERAARRRRNAGVAIAAAGAATGAGAYMTSSRRRERLLGRAKGLLGHNDPAAAAEAGPNGRAPGHTGATGVTPGPSSASTTA